MEQQTMYCGCDDGYAVIKLAYWDEAEKKTKTLQIPSKAVTGKTQVDSKGQARASYETEGFTFTVTKAGSSEDTRFDSYPTSAVNRILVHHALREAGLGGRAVNLCTGLPPGSYYLGTDINERLIRDKCKSLWKPVRAVDDRPVAKVDNQLVLMEALAALYDHMLADDLSVRNPVEGPTAIIDVGGRTSDCVTVVPDAGSFIVDLEKTGSIDFGVLKLLDNLAVRIAKDHDGLNPEDIGGLDDALRTNDVRIHGDRVEVSHHIDQAANQVAERIDRFLGGKLRSGGFLHRVLVVGGGATVVASRLKLFAGKGRNGNFLVVPENPEFANARGMLKYIRSAE